MRRENQVLRVVEMTANLESSILDLITKKDKQFQRRFKVTLDGQSNYNLAFAVSLRKVLRKIEGEWTRRNRPRKFVHLFCGGHFSSKQDLEGHLARGNCRPSKQTMAALRARDHILRKRTDEQRKAKENNSRYAAELACRPRPTRSPG